MKKRHRHHSSRISTKSLSFNKREYFSRNEQAERGVIDWELTEKKTYELLNKVGLSIDPNLLVSQIGVGQQQLVEIAKALSKSVRLLILMSLPLH